MVRKESKRLRNVESHTVLNRRNVVRVCIGRPSNNHGRVVPNDATRDHDQPSPNRVSGGQMKQCTTHAPIFVLREFQ